ncbi:hypothetical protein ABH944_008556 [Caballeronia udeis]|uniref:Lipoprotein n=1 Tax=Caballeronia udeis TaxID=1232866 RepID=A0ABW8MXL5_9BURK
MFGNSEIADLAIKLKAMPGQFKALPSQKKLIWGVVAAVVVCIIAAKIHALGSSPDTQSQASTPTPTSAPRPASGTVTTNAAVASPSTAFQSVSQPVPQATAQAAGSANPASGPNAALGDVILPGQPEPAGLTPRAMQFSLESQAQNAWSSVGSIVEQASVASFTTQAPPALAATAPTDGMLRNTWTFWFKLDKDQKTTFVYHVAGNAPVSATVAIDDSQDPLLSAKLNVLMVGNRADPVTIAGSLGLGAGWHKAVVAMQHEVFGNFPNATATAILYMHGPGEGVPVAVVPAAASSSTAQ